MYNLNTMILLKILIYPKTIRITKETEANIVKNTDKLCLTQTVSLLQSNLGFKKFINNPKTAVKIITKEGITMRSIICSKEKSKIIEEIIPKMICPGKQTLKCNNNFE